MDRRIGVFLTTIHAYARGCFLIPKNALEPKSVRITELDTIHRKAAAAAAVIESVLFFHWPASYTSPAAKQKSVQIDGKYIKIRFWGNFDTSNIFELSAKPKKMLIFFEKNNFSYFLLNFSSLVCLL